ncbi:hypothetical protein [Williamsia deligens]|uniref:Uncharacterized protein n=1 Tax=Williamsia deligens TaxID=321325 RepID=A0ABW3GAT4_9NOCA|nr:hypothetical protein [Williamsia deligens]MCP2196119.1 hypothetical protein [Williamsia deligens]
MVTGFAILGLVAIGVALVAKNDDRIKPGERAPRTGRAGITPVFRRSSHPGINGSSIGFLGVGGFDGHNSGGFDSGSCGSGDGGSGGGDGGGSC